ncbi:MAG TPA: ABC transporter substrate-binding protein [Actinomycetota bacterium]|nr:ABC transporter substrate-binding protein [Actinomycetota bacterium]
MRTTLGRVLLGVVLAIALVAAACGGDADPGGGDRNVDPESIPRGGTLRMAGTTDVDFMDPGAMYYTASFLLARGVHRQLLTYPSNPDRDTQRELVADLATDTGTVSEDGLTWMFTLRDGIKYGPALGGEEVEGVTGEEITADDIVYAVERQFNPSVGAGYPFYYEVIEGAQEFADGKAKSISGIETPDDKTLVFKLTERVGDFGFRLSMPAISPVPRAYARKFDKKKDSDYDNHVVASGPYFIAEWSPDERIRLERNPHWAADTDEVREAYVDEVDWKLGFDREVGFEQVRDGDYQLGIDVDPQGPALEQVLNDPDLSDQLINEVSSCTRFIFLNTTVEPFNSLQVRQAVAFAIDRANIKRIFGGPVTGPVATSVIPESLPGGLTPEAFNPFESENMAGDMERAKELMAQGGYPDGYDGEVLMVGASDPPHDRIAESVRADLEELGFTNLTVKTPAFPNNYTQFYQVPSQQVAIGTSPGWCTDFPESSTFIEPVFNGANITPSSTQNYSMLDDPDVNRKIQDALALPLGEERDEMWAELNREITELAAWVPWSWDSETIFHHDDLINPVYIEFFAHVDWPNAGVRQ